MLSLQQSTRLLSLPRSDDIFYGEQIGPQGSFVDGTFLAQNDMEELRHGATITFCKSPRKVRPDPIYVFQTSDKRHKFQRASDPKNRLDVAAAAAHDDLTKIVSSTLTLELPAEGSWADIPTVLEWYCWNFLQVRAHNRLKSRMLPAS